MHTYHTRMRSHMHACIRKRNRLMGRTQAKAAEEIAREARARAARLDAVVNEASHAAALVDAARY